MENFQELLCLYKTLERFFGFRRISQGIRSIKDFQYRLKGIFNCRRIWRGLYKTLESFFLFRSILQGIRSTQGLHDRLKGIFKCIRIWRGLLYVYHVWLYHDIYMVSSSVSLIPRRVQLFIYSSLSLLPTKTWKMSCV